MFAKAPRTRNQYLWERGSRDRSLKERRMYEVEIVETLCKIESVEADSIEDAIEQVEELYSSSDIVLGSGEFVDVDFMPSQEEKLKMKRNLRSR